MTDEDQPCQVLATAGTIMTPMKGPPRDDCVTRYYTNRICERLAHQVIAITPPCIVDRPEVLALVAEAEVTFLIAISSWRADRPVQSSERISDACAAVIDAYVDATTRYPDAGL